MKSSISNATKKNNLKKGNRRRLVITDVSRIKEDIVCIFGVDGEDNHIRPVIPYELVNKKYLFDEEGNYIVKPFSIIELDLIRHYPNPPHNEDYILNPCSRPVLVRNLDEDEAEDFLESILDGNVESIFESEIINKRYIIHDDSPRSIGTVKVKKIDRFIFNSSNNRPRIVFWDESMKKYDFPVTDCAFIEYYRNCIRHNISSQQLNHQLKTFFNKNIVYLRAGLTRKFGNYNHHILATGIYSFPDYKNLKIY